MKTAMRVTFTEARTAAEIAARKWGCALRDTVVTMGNDEHATVHGPDEKFAHVTAGVELVADADEEAAAHLDAMLRDDDAEPVATVHHIGPSPGECLAAELMRRAIVDCGGETIVLDAQQHLEAWYQGFGFVRSGEVFVEDGIPHIPMTRAAGKTAL